MPQRPATDSPAYGPLDPLDPLDPHEMPAGALARASVVPAAAAADHPADHPVGRPADPAPAAARTQNPQLAALIEESGFSHAGLARRVDQLGLEHGLDLRYDKTSVTRWLRGQQPRGATPP